MDVFQFLDPYLVLQNYYQTRKEQDSIFSYNTWADELGLGSSSTLRMMVMKQKKLSSGVAEKFISQSLVSEDEKNYFRLLVHYVHANNKQEKSAAWAALAKILSSRLLQDEAVNYVTYLSDALLPKLQTMLSFDDQEWNESNLRAALNVGSEDLRGALEKLKSIDMIQEFINDHNELCWKAKETLVKVSPRLGDVVVKAYHNTCLDEAKEAQELPVDQRRFRSLILPLSADEFQQITGDVEQFVRQLLATYQANQYQDRRLYKLNLNYFPVSQKLVSEDAVNA